MKAELSRVRMFLMCQAVVWSVLGCLYTAFSLPAGGVVLLALLSPVWTAGSLALCSRRWGRTICLLLSGLLLAAGWLFFGLDEELRALAAFCGQQYAGGHPAGSALPDLTWTAALVGSVLISYCAGALVRSRSAGMLFLLVVSLCVCLPDKTTVPALPFLGCALVCMLLLLLSGCAQSARNASGIIAIALVPAVLSVFLLFRVVPQETYVNHSQQVREALAEAASELLRMLDLDLNGAARRIDLRTLKDLEGGDKPAAEVTADYTGVLYLRDRDYDRYTGTAWEASANRTETLSGLGDPVGQVTVTLPKAEKYMLLPCFPEGEIIFANGAAENSDGLLTLQTSLLERSMGGQPGVQWLELPGTSFEELRMLATAAVPENSSTDEAAEAVAVYVRSAASYSRTPEKMPSDAEDFVLWFLKDAGSGYCTHFASAAAVLLRAYGIPARFVTGYRVETKAGLPRTVTEEQAHAWVEYYNYQTWTWTLLEVTPGFEEPVEAPEPETEPTTLPPPETTVPTEPTEPSETTEPTEPPEEETPLPQWPGRVLLLLFLLLIPDLQRTLRQRLRRQRQTRGPANTQARFRWREIEALSRLAGRKPPELLQALAEKAAWSSHSLTREELKRMDAGIAALRRLLRSRKWYQRLLYRYIFAAI